MKKGLIKALNIAALSYAIAAILAVGIGFYKISVYENGEYSWEKTTNAYVGGDAYNFIINGTYFSGYMALGGALFVCASVSKGAAAICECLGENEQQGSAVKAEEIASDELPEL